MVSKFIILSCIFLSFAHGGIKNERELTHKIESSRVLCMKIIKSHALIGTKNHFNDPDTQMKNDYGALNNNLLDINQYLASHPSENLQKVKALTEHAAEIFSQLKKNDLLHQNGADKAIAFFKVLEKTRVDINKAAEIMTAKKEKRDVYFFTTRLSTIAQKMAAVYLYKTWGIALPKLDEHFAVMTRKSGKSIKALEKFAQKLQPKEKEAVLKKTHIIKNQIMFFIMSRQMKGHIPTLLYDKSNKIEYMNHEIEDIFESIK